MAVDRELHDLAAGYALGTLDEDERVAFEEHLESCGSCREEVDGLAEAASALAYAVEGPEPPQELRGRILAAASAEKERVVSLRRRLNPAWVAAVAAAASVAIVVGLWATVWTGTQEHRAQQVELRGLYAGTLDVSGSGEAVLTVRNLDPPPAGKGYEVWVIEPDEAPAGAGFFRHGGSEVQVKVERKVPAGSMVAVTIEVTQVAAPTAKPILTASLPA